MPTADRIDELLTHHALRPTPVRRAVLGVMADTPFALSGGEIEQQLAAGTDRVTLYRTLKSFEEQGLLHRVMDGTDIIRYASCSIECSAGAHFDNHVHFRCTVCQRIYCLYQVAVPAVVLPKNFEAHTRDYLLGGVCGTCRGGGH